MGQIERSLATLRLFGDDLIPEEISAILGASPSDSYRKGDQEIGKVTGKIRIQKTGSWRLCAEAREPEDLNAQILEILAKLSLDLNVWKALSSRYEVNFFCGLFMGGSNDGLLLSVDTLQALAVRGIKLGLDIYSSTEE